MKFIDEANVKLIAGHGGAGFVGWRREKFVPMGGPDGGDGGDGGSVIFVAEPGLNSLMDFALNPIIRAKDGTGGGRNQLTGRAGEDVIRKIPVGTQVFYNENLIADLAVPGARWVAARGGRGGKGNAFFKSSTNQSPTHAQSGQPGEIFQFQLVLKSVADVGLIGFPNAGKSTFISRISAARPKIAEYPFTTLQPNLGVVSLDQDRQFVVADIPGLIPGAHQGKGLGIRFLKHIERTAVLAQFIDVTSSWEDLVPPEDENESALAEFALLQFQVIEKELGAFSETLLSYPRIVIFSKADLPTARIAYHAASEALKKQGIESFLISSVTGEGIKECNERLYQLVHDSRMRSIPRNVVNAS